MVAPTTLMTVAARAYDLGLKDDAVFWFYAGKNRFLTFARVIDVKDEIFRETESANAAFLQLVGNVVNPYAFCDLAKQRDAAARARDWVKAHPYKAIFDEKFPSHFADRAAALKAAEDKMDAALLRQDEFFADPAKKADFLVKRKANNADERFCD